MQKTVFLLASFIMGISVPSVHGWSWDSAENVLPSLREDMDKEVAAYRQQVLNGMGLRERILALDRIINNFKPMGLGVSELETEMSRLILEEKQQQMRASDEQGRATSLYELAIAQYKEGEYQKALTTIQDAERLLPQDKSIKETRRRLSNIAPIMESEVGDGKDSVLIRTSVSHYIKSDPRRAINALIYAQDKKIVRAEIGRLRQLIEADHPEFQAPNIPQGITLVEHKLQQTLESIYDGRYLSAISECSDILDLEPTNVLALTRLGSAYYAMNERAKARQIWTKALQYDPNNNMLKKFLYSQKGSTRVETR